MKERLDYILTLDNNQMGKSIKGLRGSWGALQGDFQKGVRGIGYGAAGLAGSVFAISRGLEPARDMANALGEVEALGVDSSGLKTLEKTALKTSIAMGTSATDIVRSAYDIQSSFDNLTGAELSSLTRSSAVLAKATKSDAATITDYMGTMYGIFKKDANEMGKSKWGEQLAGQTAVAVKMFKTTGSQMASGFSALGADAQSHGVSINEQMAVLGKLQSTMSGSEAGTKYRAFLAGVGKAQDKLGLSFTDSEGRMLPMLDILSKIKGKYGEIDTTAESDLLQKAFGTKEAVALVKLLSNDMGGLADNMESLGQVSGMDKALGMAGKQLDPWARFNSMIEALAITFGNVLLPVINPLLEKMVGFGEKLMHWQELFPNISDLMGKMALGTIGIIGAFGLLSVVTSALGIAFGVLTSPIILVGMLGAAAGALVYYWDDVKKAFSDGTVFNSIIGGINWLIEKIESIPFIDSFFGDSSPPVIGGPSAKGGGFGRANLEGITGGNGSSVSAGDVITRAVSNTNNQRGGDTYNATIHTNKIENPMDIIQKFAMAG